MLQWVMLVCIIGYKKMKSNIFLSVIIVLSLLFYPIFAQASPVTKQDAMVFANNTGKKLLMSFQEKDLEKRYQNLDDILVKRIDIDYIGKFVIGKYWRTMTKEQQQKYMDIFKRYGLAYYKTLPLEFASTLSYEVKNAEIDGKFTNIFTVVHFKLNEQPQDLSLVFRVHEADGIIKVVDVKIAESSMLLAYRSKFYKMISKNEEEIDWFLEDLEDITLSWEKSLSENLSSYQKYLEIEQENL